MGDSSLREIVKAFQAGSSDAFAELVGRYQNLATSIAFANSGDLQRSEDIAQQAFLVAWQKQSELADPDRFAGWIRGIVTNVARNERRIKENRVQKSSVELTEHDAPATSATPQNRASRKEQNELLWNSLNQIPLEYREPLVLFYREDLSVAAVAEQLELSQDAVKQRLSRGRKMLKQEIETMVEDFLVDSKPAGNFTAGVIAALPAVSATAKAAAIKTAAATVGSKAASAVTAVTFWGTAFGIFGALGGLLGARRGIKNDIKRATSEEEVEELERLLRIQAPLMLANVLGTFAVVQLPPPWRVLGVVAVQAVFMGILMMLLLRFNRRQSELHRVHGLPEGCVPTSNEHFNSPENIQTRFWSGVGSTAGAIIGGFGWMLIVAIRLQTWWLAGLVVLLVGLLLIRSVNFFALNPSIPQAKIFQHMQAICRDLGVAQCLLLILLGASGALVQTQGTIEGYPVWVFLAFIAALCTGLYIQMGYLSESARRNEQTVNQDRSIKN